MESRPDLIAVADAALDRVVALQAQIDALCAARAETLVEFEEALTVPVQTLLGGAEPGTAE